MKRPVELDVIPDENNKHRTHKALIDLDDVSFVSPISDEFNAANELKYTRMKFKGSAYVIVALPYTQVKELVIGSRVNSIMFEESSDEQRSQPVQASESPRTDSFVDDVHPFDV